MTSVPTAATLAELVRLPAVLTVPGDVLLGVVAASSPRRVDVEARFPRSCWGPVGTRRALGLTAASSCLYLAGMALNDYADRDVDAVERPHRPIPSGRVTPRFAFWLAVGLTAAGVDVAATVGGRRVLRVAVPLAATVWGYDLVAKDSVAGPPTMAAARALDVLLGASGQRIAAALPAAGVVAAHTLLVTLLSRDEARGSTPTVPRMALAGTGAVTAAAAIIASRQKAVKRTAGVAGLLAAYAAPLVRAQLAAARDPSPRNIQQAVGTGVLGIMPLEAGLLAAAGAGQAAAALAVTWAVARRLARRRPVT